MKRFSLLFLTAALLPTAAGASTLLKTDFDANASAVWSNVKTTSNAKSVHATVALASVGTVDVAGSAQPSQGLLLTARSTSTISGTAALVTGLLPVKTTETNLGKLTLSFSLSSSNTHPILVRVESFDKTKKRTGSLVGPIYPAAPNFYQRYALDLNTLKPAGDGKFQPTAPYVQFTFVGSVAATDGASQIRLDNVNYATPAYYVSPKGSDSNDGRTEATAFANPQKALDVSQPGDIIDVMDGTYISPNGPSTSPPASGGLSPVANFTHPGTPAAWIVLKKLSGPAADVFLQRLDHCQHGAGV